MARNFQDVLVTRAVATPWFARLALVYLEQGDSDTALRVCREGMKRYPRYVTGNLVLAKCYEALGRRIEAALEYRRVLEVLPDNQMVKDAVRQLERQEQVAFETFAQRRQEELRTVGGSVSFEQYNVSQESPQESSVDFLIKQLQEVRRSTTQGQGEQAGEAELEDGEAAAKIVTETLAEIYASQNEFHEAIKAYRKLLELRPEEAPRYEKRLAELQERARMEGGEST
ncbi:MAG: tetratricopeptide repeat protein [Bacteroidota bacterium]